MVKLFQFTNALQSAIGRPPMIGVDVLFQLQSFGSPPTYQCLVKLPCLGGQGFAGEVAPSQEAAQEQACDQAMPFVMSQSQMAQMCQMTPINHMNDLSHLKRPGPMGVCDDQPLQKKGKGKSGGKGEITSLSREQVEAITQLIMSYGGGVSMGRISQDFLGVKRTHLAQHFEIARVDSLGSFEIRLPGPNHIACQNNMAAAESASANPFGSQQVVHQELNAPMWNQQQDLNAPMGNLQHDMQGGIQPQPSDNSQQLQGFIKNFFDEKGFGFVTPSDGSEDLFAHIEDNAFMRDFYVGQPVSFDREWDDRKGKYKAMNAAPRGGLPAGAKPSPPFGGKPRVDKRGRQILDLDPSQVAEITSIISNAGGTVPLGRLSQVFPGIKPTQLKDHFICENGAYGILEIKLR